MKKIISIFVIIVLALSPAAVSATAQAVEFVLGDVNGDGIVSISDVTAIQRHLAQLELIPEEKLNAAMVNDGKTLTISDATTIQKKLAELIDRFPVEEQTDVILYSGNQMVVFYGSNTWAYTRLGHITDKTQAELATLLSNGNVTVILTF